MSSSPVAEAPVAATFTVVFHDETLVAAESALLDSTAPLRLGQFVCSDTLGNLQGKVFVDSMIESFVSLDSSSRMLPLLQAWGMLIMFYQSREDNSVQLQDSYDRMSAPDSAQHLGLLLSITAKILRSDVELLKQYIQTPFFPISALYSVEVDFARHGNVCALVMEAQRLSERTGLRLTGKQFKILYEKALQQRTDSGLRTKKKKPATKSERFSRALAVERNEEEEPQSLLPRHRTRASTKSQATSALQSLSDREHISAQQTPKSTQVGRAFNATKAPRPRPDVATESNTASSDSVQLGEQSDESTENATAILSAAEAPEQSTPEANPAVSVTAMTTTAKESQDELLSPYSLLLSIADDPKTDSANAIDEMDIDALRAHIRSCKKFILRLQGNQAAMEEELQSNKMTIAELKNENSRLRLPPANIVRHGVLQRSSGLANSLRLLAAICIAHLRCGYRFSCIL